MSADRQRPARLPTWQLPAGVSRALWDQMHDLHEARSYDARLSDTPLLRADLDFVRRHCRPPGRLIDLGCGTGRLALAMARDGHKVVAVDLSPAMLRVLGENAAAAGLPIERAQANLVDLSCFADGSFDHAACLFSTLGLIAGQGNRRNFLRHVHRLLRPGGTLVVHVHNRWHLLRTRHGRRMLLGNLGGGDFVMPPREGVGPLPMHLFTRREIARCLREAGFRIVEILPVSASATPRLRLPWLVPGLRAYGFLAAASR